MNLGANNLMKTESIQKVLCIVLVILLILFCSSQPLDPSATDSSWLDLGSSNILLLPLTPRGSHVFNFCCSELLFWFPSFFFSGNNGQVSNGHLVVIPKTKQAWRHGFFFFWRLLSFHFTVFPLSNLFLSFCFLAFVSWGLLLKPGSPTT